MSFSDFKDDKNRMDNWREYLTKGVERLEEGLRDRAGGAFDDLDAQMRDYDEDDEQPQRRQQPQQPQQRQQKQQPQQRQQKQQPQQRQQKQQPQQHQKQQKKQNVRTKSVNKAVSQANATPEQKKQIQKLAKKYLLAAYKKNPKGNISMMKTRAERQARQQVLAPMQEGTNDLPPGAKTGTGVEGYKAQDAQQAQKRLGQQFEQQFKRYKAKLIPLIGQDGWGKMRQAFINAALKFAKEQGVTYATEGVADAAVPAATAVFKQLRKKKKQQAAPQQQQKKQQEQPDGGSSRPSLKKKSAWLKWHIENSGTKNMGMALGRAERAYAKAIKKAGMSEGVNDWRSYASEYDPLAGMDGIKRQKLENQFGDLFGKNIPALEEYGMAGPMKTAFVKAGGGKAGKDAAFAVYEKLKAGMTKSKPAAAPQQQQKKQNVRTKSVNKATGPATPEQEQQIKTLAAKYQKAFMKKGRPRDLARSAGKEKARQEVLASMQEGHDCAVHKRKGLTHKQWESQLEEVHVDPGNLNEFLRLIREEIEVVLSDAEAKEFFGDDALSSGNLQEQMDMGWLKQQIQNGIRDAKLQGEAAAKFEADVLAKYGKKRFSSRRIHSWTKNIQLMARALQEEKSGKCPSDGCVQEREKGWVVISNKTGQCWGRSKQGADADCTYYDSREDAESALGAYHAGGG